MSHISLGFLLHWKEQLPTKWEGGGGHVKCYPYEKGGGKSFSHGERGAQQVLG